MYCNANYKNLRRFFICSVSEISSVAVIAAVAAVITVDAAVIPFYGFYLFSAAAVKIVCALFFRGYLFSAAVAKIADLAAAATNLTQRGVDTPLKHFQKLFSDNS